MRSIAIFLAIFFLSFTNLWAASSKSNLIISPNSTFTPEEINFSPGQKIFLKVESKNEGTLERTVNLRDNLYQILQTFPLDRVSSGLFQTSFNLPNDPNFYSIETVLREEGSVSKLVKTVKVGSPKEAKVKIDSQIKENNREPKQDEEMKPEEEKPTVQEQAKPPEKAEKSFLGSLFSWFTNLFNAVFPHNII